MLQRMQIDVARLREHLPLVMLLANQRRAHDMQGQQRGPRLQLSQRSSGPPQASPCQGLSCWQKLQEHVQQSGMRRGFNFLEF